MRRSLFLSVPWLVLFAATSMAQVTTKPGPTTTQQASASQQTAHFHHVHLNTTDPAAAIDFYTAKFKARKEKFAGLADAVWTGDSWLLFTKVNAAPPTDLVSGIWHIGWGAEDMKATFDKQVASGTKFATPITDISEMVGGRPFWYAYVDGPDHALIELNTSGNHNFGHVHMFSADPPAAGEWYAKYFGVRVRTQKDPRVFRDNPIAPAAFVTADHVSMIIYPVGHSRSIAAPAWKDRTELATTRGRVIDHLGFSVDNLDATLAKLKQDGVKIVAEPRSIANGQIKFAFVEGPDEVGIELLEDHTTKPGPITE
jgi:catechol 2,3-dioxygenase-like lactoylglutathione lyase family enzyme